MPVRLGAAAHTGRRGRAPERRRPGRRGDDPGRRHGYGGIIPGDLDRVFERFWRADRSGTRHTSGSGLGLAIVRQSTRAHGGTVTADSVPGEGPVFTLRLPVTVADRRPTGGRTAEP
ncbi:ATP-binding protein [Streptomyces sp. NPDC057052]|uniref:ATP-binding protein n=1 Tax=Streptomyces sp. NPDC057052 TaxID=3346010 RepID=UPI00363703BE